MESGPVVIVPYKDGPYLVRGPVSLRDQDGESIELTRRPIALCRCGKSLMRPFCDGTHAQIRFRAASGAELRGRGSIAAEPRDAADATPAAPSSDNGRGPAEHPAQAELERAQRLVEYLLDGSARANGGEAAALTRLMALLRKAQTHLGEEPGQP